MQAILSRRYGSPDVLSYEETERPAARDDEVLIRVHAASVNPYDWHFMRGTPYLLRMMAGLSRPKDARLGVDVAGVVEACGTNITQFKPGDEVFGACRGAFAEYACTSEARLAMKPGNVTYEQAAAAVIGGVTALFGLRDVGRVQPGQKVLINGAAGGVGTFAVQIARSFGADVTGVCSTRNVDMVRSIGADRVVDYTKDDFTRSRQRYDLMVDCIGNHSLSACRRVLNPNGTYAAVGGPNGRWIGPFVPFVKVLVQSPFVSQSMRGVMAKVDKDSLMTMQELMASGEVTPVIDRRYPLSGVPEAIRYLEQGHARGKVVITVCA